VKAGLKAWSALHNGDGVYSPRIEAEREAERKAAHLAETRRLLFGEE
jgi:hypothetical protein